MLSAAERQTLAENAMEQLASGLNKAAEAMQSEDEASKEEAKPDLANLQDKELFYLLEEAYSYKSKKDRQGKSEIFRELLEKAEENSSGEEQWDINFRKHFVPDSSSSKKKKKKVSESSKKGGSLSNLSLLSDSECSTGGRGGKKKGRSSVSSRSREGGSLPPTKFENAVLWDLGQSVAPPSQPPQFAWDSGGKVMPGEGLEGSGGVEPPQRVEQFQQRQSVEHFHLPETSSRICDTVLDMEGQDEDSDKDSTKTEVEEIEMVEMDGRDEETTPLLQSRHRMETRGRVIGNNGPDEGIEVSSGWNGVRSVTSRDSREREEEEEEKPRLDENGNPTGYVNGTGGTGPFPIMDPQLRPLSIYRHTPIFHPQRLTVPSAQPEPTPPPEKETAKGEGKRKARRKKQDAEKDTVKAEDIEGYRGNTDLDTILQFIDGPNSELSGKKHKKATVNSNAVDTKQEKEKNKKNTKKDSKDDLYNNTNKEENNKDTSKEKRKKKEKSVEKETLTKKLSVEKSEVIKPGDREICSRGGEHHNVRDPSLPPPSLQMSGSIVPGRGGQTSVADSVRGHPSVADIGRGHSTVADQYPVVVNENGRGQINENMRGQTNENMRGHNENMRGHNDNVRGHTGVSPPSGRGSVGGAPSAASSGPAPSADSGHVTGGPRSTHSISSAKEMSIASSPPLDLDPGDFVSEESVQETTAEFTKVTKKQRKKKMKGSERTNKRFPPGSVFSEENRSRGGEEDSSSMRPPPAGGRGHGRGSTPGGEEAEWGRREEGDWTFRGYTRMRGSREQVTGTKSTCSVPPSDASDTDDHDSVHSLPVSSTLAKGKLPAQSVSSGHTPQASYADIARLAAALHTQQAGQQQHAQYRQQLQSQYRESTPSNTKLSISSTEGDSCYPDMDTFPHLPPESHAHSVPTEGIAHDTETAETTETLETLSILPSTSHTKAASATRGQNNYNSYGEVTKLPEVTKGDVKQPSSGDVKPPQSGDVKQPLGGDVKQPLSGDVKQQPPVVILQAVGQPPSSEDDDGQFTFGFEVNESLLAMSGGGDNIEDVIEKGESDENKDSESETPVFVEVQDEKEAYEDACINNQNLGQATIEENKSENNEIRNLLPNDDCEETVETINHLPEEDDDDVVIESFVDEDNAATNDVNDVSSAVYDDALENGEEEEDDEEAKDFSTLYREFGEKTDSGSFNYENIVNFVQEAWDVVKMELKTGTAAATTTTTPVLYYSS